MLGRTCASEGSTFGRSGEQQLCRPPPGAACSPQGAKRARVQAPTLSKQFPVALAPVSDMCHTRLGPKGAVVAEWVPCVLPCLRGGTSQMARSGVRCWVTQGGRSQLRPVPWGR